MRVSLKVVGGKHNGRQIAISVPRFIIGRGETAHLRPASDMISREHCAIETSNGQVVISDLGSRNGTFVNGEKLTGAHECKSGDEVRVGRLTFEIVLDPVKPSVKKPKVKSAVEAASRTAAGKSAQPSIEDSITDWLTEGDDDDIPDKSEREELSNAETVQLKLDDTTRIKGDEADIIAEAEKALEEASAKQDEKTDEVEGSGRKGKKKASPMKLPKFEKEKLENSTAAADDVLRKFFNRR